MASSPFGFEHSDVRVDAGLRSGLCDLFKSSQGCEKLHKSEQGSILLFKWQLSSSICPVSKGSSEVMKIFGSPTFQLKASTPQEACSEVLKTVCRYLKRGLQQSRALEQGSRNTEGVVMKSQKY